MRKLWRTIVEVVMVAFVVVAIAFMVCGMSGCVFDGMESGIAAENARLKRELRSVKGEAEAVFESAAESETSAAMARVSEEKARLAAADAALGKAAAKESLATAARWVGRASYVFMFMAFVGAFLAVMSGGIALIKCLMLGGIGAAGVFVQFFILAHGYVVSEAISWVIMAAIPITALWFGVAAVRGQWDAKVARGLAVKRLEAGESPRDALMKLPVGKGMKKKLDDAWESVRVAVNKPEDKIKLLERFGLPVPG